MWRSLFPSDKVLVDPFFVFSALFLTDTSNLKLDLRGSEPVPSSN